MVDSITYSDFLKVVLIGIIAFLYQPIIAQDPSYFVFDVEKGMPSNEIYDIISDSNNNLWISTDRGICKYDGYNIQIFTTEDGLADNTNFKIFIDSSDVFWLSGFNNLISNIHNDSIYQYGLNNDFRKIINEEKLNWVRTISEDTLGNIYITVNTAENPIVIGGNDFLEPIDPRIEFEILFELNECNFLSRIGNDLIYFHDNLKISFSNIRTSKAWPVNDRLVFNGSTELFLLNSKYELIKSFDFNSLIHSFFIDDKDNIWVCTDNGLYSFTDFENQYVPVKFFENTTVSCFYQDFEGNYWIGTNTNGLYMVPSYEIKLGVKNSKLFSGEKLVSIQKLKNKLLLGTVKSKIIICDSLLNCESIRNPFGKLDQQVFFDGNDNTKYNKIQLSAGVSFNGKKFERERTINIPRKYFYSKKYYLENEDLVFQTANGLEIFSPKNKLTYNIEVDGKKLESRLTTLNQDENENIYIGTMSGLYKVENYDYNNAIEIKDTNGFSLKRISSTIITENGVWVSTIGNGTFAFKGKDVIRLSDYVQLSSVMINNAFIFQDSILGLATNNGIDVLSYTWQDSLEVKYIRNINYSDGIPSNYVNDIEYWKGFIWAATNNGICRFKPDIIDREVPQIPIYITHFECQDSTYQLDQDLELQYDQNDILISYSGLSFKQQNTEIQYKYRLSRKDETDESQWYYTNDRDQRFNDLIPGNYLFEVNAANTLRIWNDNPATISFTIHPHFTQTLLFKISMTALGFLAIYLIYRAQMNRLRKKQDREQELAKAKQKTQEAELASIRNQMNPHFVYNSLNSIQNLIFKDDKEGANHYMSKFSKLMRQSLQFSRLDFIDLEKEIQFLTNYLDLEVLRFPGKFKAIFEVSEEIISSQVLIPSLILQPIVENSIKHGFNNISYEGIITIKVELIEDDFLMLIVADNGQGSKSSLQPPVHQNSSDFHESIGTELVKTRIDLLNNAEFKGSATIEEIATKDGYTTTIRIPLISSTQ